MITIDPNNEGVTWSDPWGICEWTWTRRSHSGHPVSCPVTRAPRATGDGHGLGVGHNEGLCMCPACRIYRGIGAPGGGSSCHPEALPFCWPQHHRLSLLRPWGGGPVLWGGGAATWRVRGPYPQSRWGPGAPPPPAGLRPQRNRLPWLYRPPKAPPMLGSLRVFQPHSSHSQRQ